VITGFHAVVYFTNVLNKFAKNVQ